MSGMVQSGSGLLPAWDKVDGRHRERLAVVYVRQSTVQQVERHQESTRLQYGLVERALHLGWARSCVEVIDDDQGKSGISAEGRPGFQRLVAEVGLGHVGLVLGIEMSRLARSCRDWHQLLEICALFDTLIADADGVYDPASYNDRLLLGLKGTMSEAELHILKARMHEGRLAKARRGELALILPMGYLRRPSGEVVLDPDEQAQATIRLIFDVFERSRTLNGLLRYLVAHDVGLPIRVRSGPRKGELEWHRANRHTLGEVLRNPVYAGAYAYGRRPLERRRQPGAGRRSVTGPEDWAVLIRDRLPAYITWEHYERNLRQLAANRSHYKGVVRGGPSLLSGLLVCGRCGRRMATQYNSNGYGLRYSCSRMAVDYGGEICQSLVGRPLDALVGELVLAALKPSALEVSLRLAEDIEAERAALKQQWSQRLERARHAAERARRQYDAVEPENRLVARSLERQWEAALAAELRLKAEHERFLAEQPAALSAAERTAIQRLASDIPALWQAETTSREDRQAIVRLMLERVEVSVEGESEKVAVVCHWAGGAQTSTTLIRPVARFEQLSTYQDLLARAAALHGEGKDPPAIASILNAEGWRPPRRRQTFNATMVRSLLYRQGLRARSRNEPITANLPCKANEWTLKELARKLEMPAQTLYAWRRKGRLKARSQPVGGRLIWLIHADQAEIARLKDLRQTPRAAAMARLPD
jgi:DNA invertase Pin-like site-specific DNA recombinase